MGKIARGVSVVFVSQIVRMGAKGGLILILTRYLLTPAEYGLLFLALAVLSMLLLFSNLGLGKAGARYLTEYRETEPELVPTIIRSTLLYRTIAIGVVSIALFLSHEPLAKFVGEPSIAVLLLVGIGYIAVKSLSGVAVMFFQGFNRMDLVAVIRIIPNVLLIVAVPLFLVLDFGLVGAISGYIVAYGVGTIVGLAIVYRYFYSFQEVSKQARKSVSRQILRYSVPLSFTMGAGVLNSRIDTILLSIFRGPTAIAYYTLGKQIADFLIAPAHSLGFGISPTFGEQKANDDFSQAARLYERSFTYTITLYGPAAAGVVLVASPAVELIFGAAYSGVVPVLQIFSMLVVVRAIDAITSDALDYLGRARSRAIAKGGLALGNVGLNLILIPPFGIIGATAATVLTHALYVGAELWIISDELPIDGRQLLQSGLVVGVITLGMSAVVYPLASHISDIPSLVAVVFVGGLVSLVLTQLTGVVDLRRVTATLT